MRRVKHLASRDTPGAQRQEDGQDDREFFRHHRDRQRQAGQCALEPLIPGEPVHDGDEDAGADPEADASRRTMRPTSDCRAVFPTSTRLSAVPIFPSSVRGTCRDDPSHPVASNDQGPRYTEGRSSPPGGPVVAVSAAAAFRTATDSPVSNDSSAKRLWQDTTVASAGTRSPSRSTMRSSCTTSRPAMRFVTPSRMTRARGLERSRSASSARSVFCSW